MKRLNLVGGFLSVVLGRFRPPVPPLNETLGSLVMPVLQKKNTSEIYMRTVSASKTTTSATDMYVHSHDPFPYSHAKPGLLTPNLPHHNNASLDPVMSERHVSGSVPLSPTAPTPRSPAGQPLTARELLVHPSLMLKHQEMHPLLRLLERTRPEHPLLIHRNSRLEHDVPDLRSVSLQPALENVQGCLLKAFVRTET